MILLNFSHPFTPDQLVQLDRLADTPVERVIEAPVQFDAEQPFVLQVQELLASVPLSPVEWQTLPLLIAPPSLNFITAVLLAELHGRMGYFPTIVRIRPVQGSLPPQFEVGEIIDLQAVRENARLLR